MLTGSLEGMGEEGGEHLRVVIGWLQLVTGGYRVVAGWLQVVEGGYRVVAGWL